MSGIVHALIGVLAFSIAVGGGGGEQADQSGALSAIAGNPGGTLLLWIVALGLIALGLFEVLTVVTTRGSGADVWKERVSEGAKAVAYLVIGITALRFALGSGSSSSQQTQGLSAKLLQAPGGVVLLVLVGIGVAAVGGYFIVKGVRQKFLDDLTTNKRFVVVLGTIGYVAKGIAIGVVGILFVVAAVTADPEKASGLDGALKSLASLPFGVVILIAVALGLIAYGVYSCVRARYAKL
jgi:hypothetical protein